MTSKKGLGYNIRTPTPREIQILTYIRPNSRPPVDPAPYIHTLIQKCSAHRVPTAQPLNHRQRAHQSPIEGLVSVWLVLPTCSYVSVGLRTALKADNSNNINSLNHRRNQARLSSLLESQRHTLVWSVS